MIACQSGFSLLEILVAFSIFAVSFALILQIFSKASLSARLSEDYATALLIAQSSLDRIGRDVSAEFGSYEEPQGKYLVETTLLPALDAELSAAERRLEKRIIEVRVIWPGNRKQHSVELRTARLFPVL